MKMRIHHALGCAAQTLIVAGTFGLPDAAAQLPAHPPVEAKAADHPGAPQMRPLSQTARSLRELETKVELAWLADPATFPCRLQARAVGTTLEVSGQVPHEAVRGQALLLAQQQSGMRVVDKIEINPRWKAPGVRKSAQVLHRQVFDALMQAFPQHAQSITVSTTPDGQIMLKGTVPTYEHKLAVSRCLGQVSGCSCIMNQLRVLADAPDGVPSSSQTAAATLLSPQPLKPQAVQPVAFVPHAEPAMATSAAPRLHPAAEIAGRCGSPSSFQASGSGSDGSLPARSTTQAEPGGTRAVQEALPAAAAKPATKPLVYTTRWRRMEPNEIASPRNSVPVASPKESAGDRTQVVSTTPTKPERTFMRLIPSPKGDQDSASNGSTPANTETAALPNHRTYHKVTSNPNEPAGSATHVPAARSQLGMTPGMQASAATVPAVGQQAPGVARREPYVTEGVILIDVEAKPAAYSVPATGQKPSTIARTGPYVASGVMLFEESGKEGELKANPALSALQTRLQQRIAAICGKATKDVEVTAITPTNVAVRMKAYSTLEAEEVSNRVFQIPELGPCQVSLDVSVMK